jgi:hypothetical protein
MRRRIIHNCVQFYLHLKIDALNQHLTDLFWISKSQRTNIYRCHID